MQPIQHLLDEHRSIMNEMADLRAATRDLAARGEAAVPDALPVLARIGHLMATRLALHARKEDDALFPALEAIFGEEGTPTAVMRLEHQDIHAQGVILRQTLHELNEVEHPAIEAGAEQLRALAAQGGSAASFLETASEIIRLLDLHFEKEEQVLFPMAESLLDEAALAAVAGDMARLEAAAGS
jgi:regulator of cell morphogenesis and NO signaling